MAIVRRRPERSVQRFPGLMSDLFGRFLEDLEPATPQEGTWAPALDVSERDDAVVVTAELPGMKSDDIDVSVQNNALTISGEKSERTEEGEKEGEYYYAERRYGSFRRTIPLPADVDTENIEASCNSGVLIVKLPKSERAKPRKIPVKS